MNGTRSRAADLEDDLEMLSYTLEEVLRASGDPADQRYIEIRDRAAEALAQIRARLERTSDALYYQTKKAVYRTDDYVHQNPWRGIGVGASLGLVVGLLLARR
ncbi:DUF883 family protein [Shimwellia pseudoproteus]|nr:DUF883 family protein [Shimwellia pseudoproteus]MBJ3814387.1 DUF883 family protein [Shimwellia pseudoproteus]